MAPCKTQSTGGRGGRTTAGMRVGQPMFHWALKEKKTTPAEPSFGVPLLRQGKGSFVDFISQLAVSHGAQPTAVSLC